MSSSICTHHPPLRRGTHWLIFFYHPTHYKTADEAATVFADVPAIVGALESSSMRSAVKSVEPVNYAITLLEICKKAAVGSTARSSCLAQAQVCHM